MAIRVFQGRRVVLAVTGSISAYKSADLASKLTQAGALVNVILTDAAQQFVSPLTFEAVTGRAVYTDLWQSTGNGALPTHIAHVGLAHEADLLAVIPATAHTIARLAHGMADDLLSVTALAATCPVVIAPAMDGTMYRHPAVAENLETLQRRGVWLIEPEVGRFASGLTGQGRLPETPTLMGHLRRVLGQRGLLSGRHVVVSAGGTREAIDPVRFVGNRSSGKQGYALAQAAVDAGAEVTLVTTVDLPLPIGVYSVRVESAAQMRDAVLKHAEQADAVIMAAAVADFRPLHPSDQKIKKQESGGLTLELGRTDDILLALRAQRERLGRPRILIGFAAESDQLLTNARRKLEQKGLDLLVANDITAPGVGFAVDTNRVTLLYPDGRHTALDLMSKSDVAERIIDELAALLTSRA